MLLTCVPCASPDVFGPMMDEPPTIFDSVRMLISQVKAGDQTAFAQLFKRYYPQVVEFVEQKLVRVAGGLTDAEDVTQQVFVDFFIGSKIGSFKKLDDRDDLWQVLTLIAVRTMAESRRAETRLKRGGGRHREPLAQEIASEEPPPEIVVELADRQEYLIGLLPTESLRAVARLTIEGRSVAEIAALLKILPRSVARKLAGIRDKWENDLLGN